MSRAHGWFSNGWRVVVAGTFVVVAGAASVAAHRPPLLLAFWGGFESRPAHCQRIIGFATARCANATWTARRACLDAQLDGGSCDIAATDTAIAQAHAATLNLLDDQCAPDDVQALDFLLNFELDADIDSACSAAEVALTSAIYGPAQRRAVAGPLDQTTLACTRSTARAATKLLRFAFDLERQTLDRIAVLSLGPSQKQPLVDRTLARLGAVQAIFERSVRADCPDASFTQLYGRDLTSFLADIAQRASCLAGAGYVQAALVCPPPLCGNGIQETAEQCDDGNTTSGDGCHGDCTLEAGQ